MKKINIFLFAAHHSSGNIAAQRFKSLMKYLDPAIYNIHVFTRSTDTHLRAQPVAERANVTAHAFDGQCVSSQASLLVVLMVLLSSFLPKLPFIVVARSKVAKLHSSWMVNALAGAESICRERLADGEKCFVIGTYSPIDALIAARCLSGRFALPNLQDFRDGFVFESLGRKGAAAAWLRSVIEMRIVETATQLTSVSTALVEDFRLRYPRLRVELLPNGYDPSEFNPMCAESLSTEASDIINDIPKCKVVVGHFGRVCESDLSRMKAFEFFVESLNAAGHLLDKVHVIFIGKLTAVEVDLLESMKCSHCILPPVTRSVALELMKRCNVLLLITGDGVGCATGKLFEYMATESDIVCFSAVKNEAANILEETGCGRTILVGDHDKASIFYQELTSGFSKKFSSQNEILKYSRINQADILSRWIQEASL